MQQKSDSRLCGSPLLRIQSVDHFIPWAVREPHRVFLHNPFNQLLHHLFSRRFLFHHSPHNFSYPICPTVNLDGATQCQCCSHYFIPIKLHSISINSEYFFFSPHHNSATELVKKSLIFCDLFILPRSTEYLQLPSVLKITLSV